MTDTRERLLLAATQIVQRQGLSLSESGRRRLLGLIDQGLNRLESDGASLDTQVVIGALERIVEHSITAHRSLRNVDAGTEIGDFAINGALRGLCPIYPFC